MKQFLNFYNFNTLNIKIIYLDENANKHNNIFSNLISEQTTYPNVNMCYKTKTFDIYNLGKKVNIHQINSDEYIADFLSKKIRKFIYVDGLIKDLKYRLWHNNNLNILKNNIGSLAEELSANVENNIIETIKKQIIELKLFNTYQFNNEILIYINPITEEYNSFIINEIKSFSNVTLLYNKYLPIDEVFINVHDERNSGFMFFQYNYPDSNYAHILIDSIFDHDQTMNYYRRIKF